ncbi:MAG: glycosyltransferase family 2 protein, partial [Candidatus Staskawiczbacteria bacterium]
KLSIIMPCYNCQSTLAEAVVSVFVQSLKIPFEIIMVDDGSTDGTQRLILELAQKYPEIKTLIHEKNRGGGAARNTGIKNSSGDLIFCLDGDDILPPAMLPRLLNFLDQKNLILF